MCAEEDFCIFQVTLRAEQDSRKFNLSKDEEIRALKKKCILLLWEDSKRGRCLLDIIFLQVIKLHFLGLIIDSLMSSLKRNFFCCFCIFMSNDLSVLMMHFLMMNVNLKNGNKSWECGEGDRAEKMFENFDNCDTNRRFIYERFDKLLPRKLRFLTF